MKFLPVAFVTGLLMFGQIHAQFGLGKLKKALDTAQKVSEMDISEEDEIALGQSISEKIRARFGVDQDADATRYLTLVGLTVAAHSDRPDLPYQFIILDSNQINAFAAPGGFIHMTRGALASITDEAELAGVLGHEIAHVTERHTIKGIQKVKGLEIAEGTTLRGNGAVLDQLSEKMTDAILSGFGRKEELEADKVGLKFAADCNYDPTGLNRFLELLTTLNDGSESRAGLFASHPETEERLKKLTNEIEKRKLASAIVLPDRYKKSIRYEVVVGGIEELTEGTRGVAGGGKKKEEGEEKEKKKGGFLAKLSNPLGSGEKKQTAEVTGAGAGRAVGKEQAEAETGPKNPNVVAVKVTPEDLEKFKKEGNLT